MPEFTSGLNFNYGTPATATAAPTAVPSYGGYNLGATPQGGSGVYGAVPGNISAPPSIYDQLNANVPNYSALTSSATGDIASQLAGQVSQGTQNQLVNAAASRGVTNGLGTGSSFTGNNFLESLGLTSEGLQNQGLTNYNTLSSTAGSQQQNPALLAGIAQQNAVNSAAPNPFEAQSYAQQLFDQYLNNTANPGGGSNQTQAQKLGLNNNGTYYQVGGTGPYIPGEPS